MKLTLLNLSVLSRLIVMLLLIKSGEVYGQTATPSKDAQRTQSITINVSTTSPSCGNANGVILITATGGTAPYTYSLNGFWQNNGYFPDRDDGTYSIVVKDAAGLTQSTSVVLTETIQRPGIVVSSFVQPTTCDSRNGTVTLAGSGGLPPYQYSLTYDGVYQNSNVFTNLISGKYVFYVKDANGCISGTVPLELSGVCPIYIAMGYTGTVLCDRNGVIGVQITRGGYPPYQYSIDGVNYQNDSYFRNLGPGIYTVYVRDTRGQIKTASVQMNDGCELTISYVGVDAACLQNNGSLTITAENGFPPYSYTIDGVNYQSSNVFSGLAPGNYTIAVKDAAGTIRTKVATVIDRCPVISLTSTGESCTKNDGSITASAVKGTAPYQYSIDGINFQSGNMFSGLVAGTYTITLKDALGFTDAKPVTVDNICLTVTASGTNSSCGNSNGSISATASLGTAPYQFSINGINFQSNNTFNGLAAGAYTITAKDVNGRTGTTTITISDEAAPLINVNTTAASCSNDNGSFIISGAGGKQPFQFSRDGINYQSGNTFTNLPSGSYTAYIKDANNCISSQGVNVALSCPTVTASVTNETCSSRNGIITATGANGNPPYQYSRDGINYQSSNIFTGLGAGAYTITIKDALGATNSVAVTIVNICPVVTTAVTDGLCGTANASIIATGTNGTAPYGYSIDGINFQSSNTFASLANGTYTITIRDANGLTNSTNATVQNYPGPSGMTLTPTTASCVNNDGSITIQAIGGISPLQYSINGTNYQTSNVFNNIASSAYTVWVKDVNGCLVSQTVTVPFQDDLSLSMGNDTIICEGTSVVMQNVSNGSNFVWSPASGLNSTAILNPAASPVSTTKYYVTATLGVCSKVDSLIVSVNSAPVADAGKDSIICYGKDIQLGGSGGTTFEWIPSAFLNDPAVASPIAVSPTSTTTYSLYVTDNNGCRSLQPALVKITVTPPAKVFAGNDTAIVMNQPFTIRGVDINNSGFVDYSWSPSYGLNNSMVQNPVAILDRDMTYTLTATTVSGCKGTDEVTIKVYKGPEIYVPTAFTPNNDGLNDILKATPVGIKEFRYFVVFNRWGQRVFYTIDANKGWDGKLSGTEQGNNSFTWMAEGIDDRDNKVVRKGSVIIVR